MTCFDKKSENVRKWNEAFGKDFTYREFLIHNYFLPKFEDYIAVNKEAIHISKMREVLNDIISPELFKIKEIESLKEIGDVKAEGAFYKDTLYFAEQANIYTAYEEGFHAIFQRLVPNENRQEILKAGKALLENRLGGKVATQKYLKDKYVGRNEEYAIEEEIAKEFINYKLYKTSGILNKNTKIENLAKKLSVFGKSAQSIAETLINFFEYLSKFFNNVVENKHKLQALFELIGKGAFTSSVKLNNVQYDFPSLRPILLDGNRTLNQKTQANIYSGIKSIYKAVKTGDLNTDIELAIKLYKDNVAEGDINSLLVKEMVNRFTKETVVKDNWKTVFEDVKKQIENSTFLLEDEIDEEDGDAISDQINGSSDRDSEKSAIARLSAFSRDYISNIGDLVKVFNYNNKEVYVKSYIEINNVYSAVVRNLANTQDFHTKLRKLVMLSEDRKSKDSKIFVHQFLEDLFLKENYKGLSAEDYVKKRNSDLTLLKDEIKRSVGFTFEKPLEDELKTGLLYLSPEAVDLFQKVMKSFDLYTAEVLQLLVETNKGDVISYDPHKNNVVLPQLDEWRNNYEAKEWKTINSIDLKRSSVEQFRESFFDVLGIDVSDGYIKYILGINNNPDYIDFASQFDNIPEDVYIDPTKDVGIIKTFHNDKKDIYTESEDKSEESVVSKLRKIAKGNAYFDETVLESTYQDAEGKYIYAHQNKTFNLSLANVIKDGWVEKESVKEIKDEETKRIISTFHKNTPIAKTIAKGIPFHKFGRKRLGGFSQKTLDDAGIKSEFGDKSASFKEMTPEDFETSKLNLFVSATKSLKGSRGEGITFVPQFVGHFETANTAEFQYVEYLRPLDSEGNLTIAAKEQFVEYLEVEYNRIQEFIKRLVDTKIISTEEDGSYTVKLTTELLLEKGWNSAIAGYYTGDLDYTVNQGIIQVSNNVKKEKDGVVKASESRRALQLSTELNAFSEIFPLNEALTYNANTGLSKMSNLYSKINSVYQDNLRQQVGNLFIIKNKEETDNSIKFIPLPKLFKGEAETDAEKRTLERLGFTKNIMYNLKMYLANYELNSIGIDRFIYGDMLVFNKNDMSDKFKRNKISNAAIVSAFSELLSPTLGIDRQFKEFKVLIHDEVVGESDVDGGSIDKMDAQAIASVQHTRHLLFGLGRLSKQEAKLLTKVHNGEAFNDEDRKWMFDNDTFLSANKTVAYSTLQALKMSEAYSETLSKINTALKETTTEEEFIKNSTVTKDGRIYPVEGAKIEVTRELQSDGTYKYFKWTVAKDRKSLYEKRLVLEGWRKNENGKWQYKGRDFEIGLIMPMSASKRMNQNVLSLDKDGNPDWDKLQELHLNIMGADNYGLQVENQGIKTLITDPSQNIEIITNELGDVVITDMLTGTQTTLSGKDFTKTFQSILAKRDKGSFEQAYKELIKNDNPIYKYLFELIKSGIDSTSSDPQLQQLVEVDANGNYKYNLNIPLFQQKFQQYLFAYLTKGVLAQKRAGDALVMTSPHGHNLLKKLVVIKDKKGKVIDYSWKVIQRKSEEYRNNINNAIEGIQDGDNFKNFVNLQYKAENKGSWKEAISKLYIEKQEEFYFIDEVRFGVPEYKNGKVIGKFSESLMGKWDKNHTDTIQDSFRWMFGVRIPSQDKQSSINIKLVDWLEDGAGNAIVVPKEYQQLSGADYDVDKIYTYKSEGYWDGDKFVQYTDQKDNAQNFLQWKQYYFSSNKTAKKLLKNKLQEGIENYVAESEVLQELQLPSTIEEYKKSGVVNSAVENNMLLNMYQSALSSKELTTPIKVKTVKEEESPYTKEGYKLYTEKTKKGIYETGTSVDWLKKADKFYKSLAGILFKLENKTFGLRSAFTDYMYFKGSQGGKKGIGSAVNANLSALTWLKTEGYDLGISLNLDGYTQPLNYTQVTLDGLERTADNISTQITATTDEAKEQALAKYNIRGKALDVFATMLGLGFRIDQAILLVNVPMVQEYLDDRKSFSDFFPKEYKPILYSETDLSDVIKSPSTEKGFDIELAALYDFIQLEKQAEINSNLMKFIRLKRGFSPEYDSFQSILEAGHKLGFGNLPEMQNVYGKNENPLFDFSRNLTENKESILQLHQYVVDIIPQVKNVTEKFLLVASEEYKNIVKTVTNNVKVNNKTKGKIEKEVMTWMMGNSIPVSVGVIMGENTIAKEILALQETMKDNALISHLIPYINKDGFDQIGIKAFSRLTADKQESLIDGFNILLINKDTEQLAFRIYDYFGIKDGWLYKPNSISKAFPVHMFSKMSKAVEEFLAKKYDVEDVNNIIENILTDVSNKNLLHSIKEGKILGNKMSPSTFNIEGKQIPIMVETTYTNKKKEKISRKVNVEYNVTVDEKTILPNYIKDGNHLYKKYVVSDTQVKYVLLPFLGEPKIKISGVADKTVYSGDVKLAQALIYGVGGKKGRWESLLSSSIGNEYKKLIANYKKYLQNTVVVENNSVLEEGEENDAVVDNVSLPTEFDSFVDDVLLGNVDYKASNSFTNVIDLKEGSGYEVVNENKLNVSEIYSKLGNKTQSGNVVIVKWDLLKDERRAIGAESIISTRIKNSNEHFGNSFSSDERVLKQNSTLIKTNSTKESVEKYIDWVINSNESRAKWIREQLNSGELKDEPILYYTELGEPSHATALDYLINNWEKINNLTNEQQVELYRKQEQEELKKAIPNYNGNKESLSVAELKKYDEIYEKYDKLISPLLEKKYNLDSLQEKLNEIFYQKMVDSNNYETFIGDTEKTRKITLEDYTNLKTDKIELLNSQRETSLNTELIYYFTKTSEKELKNTFDFRNLSEIQNELSDLNLPEEERKIINQQLNNLIKVLPEINNIFNIKQINNNQLSLFETNPRNPETLLPKKLYHGSLNEIKGDLDFSKKREKVRLSWHFSDNKDIVELLYGTNIVNNSKGFIYEIDTNQFKNPYYFGDLNKKWNQKDIKENGFTESLLPKENKFNLKEFEYPIIDEIEDREIEEIKKLGYDIIIGRGNISIGTDALEYIPLKEVKLKEINENPGCTKTLK